MLDDQRHHPSVPLFDASHELLFAHSFGRECKQSLNQRKNVLIVGSDVFDAEGVIQQTLRTTIEYAGFE